MVETEGEIKAREEAEAKAEEEKKSIEAEENANKSIKEAREINEEKARLIEEDKKLTKRKEDLHAAQMVGGHTVGGVEKKEKTQDEKDEEAAKLFMQDDE